MIPALVAAAEGVRGRMASLREAQRTSGTGSSASHALSVQQAMHASDVSAEAAASAAMMRKAAHDLLARGLQERAHLTYYYAMRDQEYAREAGETFLRSASYLGVWSEDDADLLVEYAGLRAEVAEAQTPPTGLTDRIRRIEADRPDVMDGYAALLLEAYTDENVRCTSGAI